MRHVVLDILDELSNHFAMTQTALDWRLVDQIADSLGATEAARRKWRARQVPYKWRLAIVGELNAAGRSVNVADFDKLQSPGTA